MNVTKLQTILTDNGKYSRRTSGQIIHFNGQDTPVSYIKSGYIKRYSISKLGVVGVQSIYGPGSVFPLTAAFLDILDQEIYHGHEQYYYEAMTPTEIYSVGGSVLRTAAEADSGVYKELLQQTGVRLQSNIHCLENMALKDPYSRIAHMIDYYATNFGVKTDQGQKLTIPFKQQDIADILNINRETVTRAMGKLRERNLVLTDQGLIVPDLDKLRSVYL